MTPMRRCSVCLLRKPWSEFWAAAKWPDGTMRRPQSSCKECVKKHRRDRRRADPEWARALDKRDWERVAGTAKRRELQRQNSASFRERQRQRRVQEVVRVLMGHRLIASEVAQRSGLSVNATVQALRWLHKIGTVELERGRPNRWSYTYDANERDRIAADADRQRERRRRKRAA